ncbi:MAG: TraR/DksA C4-type zinc finger protein [Pseudomonadota bacterium]
MNTMMMALLQGRLWDAASSLQQRLRTVDRETDEAGEAALAGELSQVIDALAALQAGRYGYCSGCGQALEPDQLLLQPHRLHCGACEPQLPRGAFAALRRVMPPASSAGAGAQAAPN